MLNVLLIKFMLSIVFTEAITEVVTKSEIFSPLRAYVFKLSSGNKFFKWLHQLLDCGYCFSVWSGAFTAALLFRDCELLHIFVIAIVLHRLSNTLHNIIDVLHNKFQ